MTDEGKALPQKREDVFDKDFGEAEYYFAAADDDSVRLPVTRSGFEALLKRVTEGHDDLPVDDAARQVVSGYVHHLSNETDEVMVSQLRRVLRKSVSNALTWTIDQEIKAKRLQELRVHAEKQAAETPAEPPGSDDHGTPIAAV